MRPRIKVEIVMPKLSPVFWMLLALDTEVGTSTAPQPLPVYLPSFPRVPSHGRARNVCGQGLQLPAGLLVTRVFPDCSVHLRGAWQGPLHKAHCH